MAETKTRPGSSPALRRVLAFSVDWLVIVLWGGALFGAEMLVTGGAPIRPDNPWTAQLLGFVAMTLPVTLYFAFCESSARRATLGKRALGLVVSGESGERLPFARAFLRNAIKFIPWECGHTVAQHAMYSGEQGFAALVWIPAAVSLVGPLWWLIAMITTGRTPYDRWARAQVEQARR